MKTTAKNNVLLTKKDDWDHFWDNEKKEKFNHVSWSKRRIIDILQHFVQEGKKVLDAGCGSGFFSKYFCEQNMQTFSLDYSDKALQIAKEITQGRTHLLTEDLLCSNLKESLNEQFDVIFTDGLFEHFSLDLQDRIYKNFVSCLKNDGVIITFVPNRWSPWELIRPFFMPGIKEKPFTLKTLIDLNQRNGLVIIRQGGINTLPIYFSPDQSIGHLFGMLLFTVAKKHD